MRKLLCIGILLSLSFGMKAQSYRLEIEVDQSQVSQFIEYMTDKDVSYRFKDKPKYIEQDGKIYVPGNEAYDTQVQSWSAAVSFLPLLLKLIDSFTGEDVDDSIKYVDDKLKVFKRSNRALKRNKIDQDQWSVIQLDLTNNN